VIPADEVLAEYTQPSLDGELLFKDPSGALVRLITSTDDPEISNPGDGSFHPADVAAVVAALESLSTSFTAPLDVTIFVLPYPRSGSLSSSATTQAIFLSPGVYPMEDGETLRALVVHELGHVIEQHFLSSDPETWNTYIALREIGDDTTYDPSGPHAYRPAEIFAEDFRVLFGDTLASANPIENPTLAPPGQVSGLYDWFVNLSKQYSLTSDVAARTESPSLRLYPNPLPSGASFTLERSAEPDGPGTAHGDLTARLHDVSGRVVAELVLAARDGARWSATLPSLSAGTYWLRPPSSSGRGIRIHVVD
jgi:hypothetical protein